MISAKFLFLGIVCTYSLSCNTDFTSKEDRLFIIQEKKIDSANSFFWFRGSGQITQAGLSYFQITKDKCNLSFNNANAYCDEPIQINKINNDTIFLLTMSKIVSIKFHKRFQIIAIPYSIELYDTLKKPLLKEQYFLDSFCSPSQFTSPETAK